MTDATQRSRWTLAARLSVLFVILLLLVVGVFGTSAYVGVRDAAVERSSERLTGISRELALGIARGVQARGTAMRTIARDSTIVRMLTTAESPAADAPRGRALPAVTASQDAYQQALDSLFARRSTRTDSALLGWHVTTASGTQLYGVPLPTRDSLELANAIAKVLRTDSVVHSALYESESQIRLIVAAPVTRNGQPLGIIASRRAVLGSDSIAGVFRRITGQNASVMYASSGSDVWASVRGQRIASPLGEYALSDLPDSGTVRLETGKGDARYIASYSVAGTPWRLVLTEGEDSILFRAHVLMRQLLWIALAVLLIGTVGAWWLSRLETRPLTELRKAADAMSSGDYTRVVTPTGAQEMAALARAFNTMSTRISGAHATLHAQKEALLRANDAKARFLAVMSHELRTPLNAIGGYAELMALGVHGPTTDEQRMALERIGRSKDQLLHLVSDILSYTRLEATPLRLSPELVSAQAQFHDVRETVIEQFARKRVALVISPSDATLFADPVRVQQILVNLVTNALQFTPAGGRVEMYAEMVDETTTLFVRDTGVGLASELHDSVFEAFVQVDSTLTRSAGGAGLGLAIVRQLATAMGGDARVVSAQGAGATFSVSLPALPPLVGVDTTETRPAFAGADD